jgi:NADH-quinone oxidoreductase subunit L
MPQTTTVFLIGTLALAGIPLFAGFLSKEEILGAVWAGGLVGPFAILMLVAFLTAFYMFRVVFLAFFAAPAAPVTTGHGGGVVHRVSHDVAVVNGVHAHDPPITMLLPLWTLALLSMAVGVYFTFVHPAQEFVPPAWLMAAAVGVAVAGIALAWLTYQRRAIEPERLASLFAPIRRAALARFWIDDLYVAAYQYVLLGLSRVVGWVDRYVVDGVLNAISSWTLSAGDDLRTIQTGRAQDYIYGVAVGALALIIWMRWALL